MSSELNAASFQQRDDDVFSRIADRYDRLCDLFSLGIHRLWKQGMARRISQESGGVLLDLACGTGDIPVRVNRRSGGPERMIVSDTCPSMLELAAAKLADSPRPVELRLLDAETLESVPDASIDIVSISFGMKICDRDRVIQSAFRVLKPGGRFFCLEASRLPSAHIHAIYLLYMDFCMPVIANLATGGDRSAYDYLLRGVHEFPGQEQLAAEITAHGFDRVSYKNFTGGIVALHEGCKPHREQDQTND